jgi:uncharacterized tellurite resistance protein B-like protein
MVAPWAGGMIGKGMIKRLMDFVGRGGAPSAVVDQNQELRLAAAALLVEAARLDGEVDAAERQAIAEQLSAFFNLEGEETDALIEAARAKAKESSQLYSFTRVITDRFSEEERVRMIEMLWTVAYADGRLHDYEASLVRRVAGLIHVADRDNGDARKRVLGQLGLTDDKLAPTPASVP